MQYFIKIPSLNSNSIFKTFFTVIRSYLFGKLVQNVLFPEIVRIFNNTTILDILIYLYDINYYIIVTNRYYTCRISYTKLLNRFKSKKIYIRILSLQSTTINDFVDTWHLTK